MNQPRVMIDPLSARSLMLESTVNGQSLETATGFLVQHNDRSFLITNWHVLAGRDPVTEQPTHPSAAIPDTVRIAHHVRGSLGTWQVLPEPLHDENGKRWVEHPQGRAIDVVALPLSNAPATIDQYPFDLGLADADLVPEPAMSVSIIGFPFGLAAGGRWPIWKTGHIATDPDVDYEEGRPSFLVDATTRSGMSGSPVVVRSSGGHKMRNGIQVLASGIVTKFLGIYSGRIRGDAELGRVWRARVVTEILANA